MTAAGGLALCPPGPLIAALRALVDVGIPYVETADYGDPQQDGAAPFALSSMWIRGEWENP